MAGLESPVPLPVRDTLIGAVSTIFALMMAFSAAGIWNDTLQANTAVQREVNALENVLALAGSLPSDLAERVQESVNRYGRHVVEHDWPAMARKVGVNDPVYDLSDKVLIDLINSLALEQSKAQSLPTGCAAVWPDRRSAQCETRAYYARQCGRLGRAMACNDVDSVERACGRRPVPQPSFWDAGLGHEPLHACGGSTFFVILAHDRPFVGVISVSPAPIIQLSTAR